MSNLDTVRVGVIGRGFGGRVVAPTFDATDGCTVVDVVSPRDDEAVRALCARDDVDLISVHSPPFMHLEHVRRAIDSGHAVLCDKPFGLNPVEAKEMCDLARDAEVLNLVNFEFRYHPMRGKLRNLVLDGAVGTVEYVQWTSFMGWWRNPSRRYGWVFDASRGGGWVRAAGAHVIDYLRWTFGEIVDASAALRTTIPERSDADGNMQRCTAEDGFTATMRTEQNTWATIDATATGAVDLFSRVTVIGSDGVLELLSDSVHEIGGRILLHTKEGTSEQLRIEPWARPEAHDDSAMRPWLQVVCEAVRRGAAEPQSATFADGLACARVLDQLTGQR
jgi:predicted dehydrogenase